MAARKWVKPFTYIILFKAQNDPVQQMLFYPNFRDEKQVLASLGSVPHWEAAEPESELRHSDCTAQPQAPCSLS